MPMQPTTQVKIQNRTYIVACWIKQLAKMPTFHVREPKQSPHGLFQSSSALMGLGGSRWWFKYLATYMRDRGGVVGSWLLLEPVLVVMVT